MADEPALREQNTPSLQEAIALYLEAHGVGERSVDLWEQQMPGDPETGTVVVLTGGPIIVGDPTRRISFQVQHRNKKVGPGLQKSTQISNLLRDQWNVIPGFPGRIIAVSEAGASFKDDSGRSLFPLNFVLVSTQQK